MIPFVSDFTAPKLVNLKRIHTLNDIIDDIKNTFGVDINYQKVWRTKEYIIEILREKPTGSYCQMPRYLYIFLILFIPNHILEYTNLRITNLCISS